MNNTHTYCNAQRPDARQGTVTTNTDNKLINRLDIIASFNPHLTDINPQSPLSVGNGRFCYTADITGMQTLYEEYSAETPLCTMAEWGWHTKKADNEKGFYTLDDVRMTPYNYCKRTVTYPRVKYEGRVEFKTDNRVLFDFSVEEVKEAGWNLVECTYDLHSDERLNEGNVMTEYEKKFSDMGNPICKLIADR